MAVQVAWDVVSPYLQALRLHTPADPTYGRYLLPTHLQPEKDIDSNPDILTTRRRLFISPHLPLDTTIVEHSEDVSLTPEELSPSRKRSGRWVYYKTWELKESAIAKYGGTGKGHGVDLVIIHGLSDYGGRWSPHCMNFLKEGFRVIVPDLPTYGRSTGVHSNVESPHQLTSALHMVLQDLVKVDLEIGKNQREVFLSGASMGGWTAMYYIITFPPTPSTTSILSEPTLSSDGKPTSPDYRPNVAGAFITCPAVFVSPNSRPNFLVEGIARVLVKVAGSLPMATAVRGNVSDDPRVEADWLQDPATYHGKLRASTGLSLLYGMTDLQGKADQIKLPIRIIHGDHDRATSHKATEEFFTRIASEEKELEIYEGYEHVMCKVGIDEADDEKRQRVLKDWVGWLLKRVEIDQGKK